MTIVYQTVTAGNSYSRIVSASNTIYFATENLPQGLSINQEGVISGVLQQAGRFAITILARGLGGTSAAILDLTVNASPTPFITSVDAVTHEAGTAFSYQITASSPTAILSYGATSLPTGLSVNTGTGLITGTPTSVSNDAVITVTATVSATNAAGTGNQNLIFTLQQRPVITSSLATVSYNLNSTITPYTITASKSPILFSASNLPSGLSVDSVTGIISGVVEQIPGDFSVVLSASNSVLTGTATKHIEVNSAPIITSSDTVLNIFEGDPATYQITALAYPAITSYGWNPPTNWNINTGTGLVTGGNNQNATRLASATNSLGTGTKSVSVIGVGTNPAFISSPTLEVTLNTFAWGTVPVEQVTPSRYLIYRNGPYITRPSNSGVVIDCRWSTTRASNGNGQYDCSRKLYFNSELISYKFTSQTTANLDFFQRFFPGSGVYILETITTTTGGSRGVTFVFTDELYS
jgi:hypothetical protein